MNQRKTIFRAWYKKEKRFVYLELFKGGSCIEEDELDGKQLENWQQFTGLTDKHDKEIYEGDIVSGEDGTWDGPFEVIFEYGSWELKNSQGQGESLYGKK